MNNQIVLTVDEIWHLVKNNPELLSHHISKVLLQTTLPILVLTMSAIGLTHHHLSLLEFGYS